jgi:hypothetical protein
MKIEAGKYYRTRDGRKAFVVGVHPLAVQTPFVGVIYEQMDILRMTPCTWDNTGESPDSNTSSPEKDSLVAEWKEPAKGTVWVNINRNDNRLKDIWASAPYETKAEADERSSSIRIACIEVPWTEGEGL